MKFTVFGSARPAPLLRSLLIVAIFASSACKPLEEELPNEFTDAIRTMEQRTGGAVGVYAVDTATGRELTHRADERFAMASTVKPLLVAAVLAEVDRNRLDLDGAVGTGDVKIQPYSPVIGKLGDAREISIAELCDAAITVGDNTATNMLLDLIGGPEGLTRFLRHNGDEVTRLDRYEVELNTNVRGDERDTTTPRAMAASISRFLFSDVLSGDSRKRLQDWLVASTTGSTRLRAGLPEQWRVGDKTGTGGNGAVNNLAVAWPPGRQPLIIVVYMSWSEMDAGTLSTYHAEIAALVANHFR